MICPKCQNVMQTLDRRGVHIEQCQSCRGIFLDRGELEQIVNAEQSYYAPPAAAPPPPQYAPQQYGGHDPRYQGGHRYDDSPPPYGAHRGHKRRRSFLEDLFD